MGISADIMQFRDKLERFGNDFMREFVNDMSQEVVETTPVKTGNLRNHWDASIGEAQLPTGLAPDQGSPLARMSAVISSLKVGMMLRLRNSAAYAAYVEYGTHKMEPRAWVRRVVARGPLIAENVGKKLNGKRY